MQRMALILLVCLAGISSALAQTPVTVIGPITPGDCAAFSSTTIIKDGNVGCGAALFGSPTGSVGLTVINGSASTAMRSDAAPPLSASVQSALTGTINQVLTGTGAFGFSSITNTQLTALINPFTSALPGAVPASGGGIVNFLRADGTFAAPGSSANGSLYAPGQPNVSASSQTTTGTISASSTTLTLASAIDFHNGQGIRINHAGPATTAAQVAGQSATPNGTPGSTTYTYAVVAFDANGGYGTSAGNFSTSTGNATLSYTNYNAITWAAATGAVGYAVYGRTSGSMALLAFTTGTTFNDMGSSVFTSQTVPDWMPSTPPTAGAAQWLVTTVSSGGGTTSLTLGASSATAATSQGVFHDDTVALQAALTSATSNNQSLNLGNGIYRITSALTAAGPLQIYSNGMNCCGLVPGTVVLTSPTQDGFQLTGNYIILHDLNFEGGSASGSGQVAGSAINFTTGSGAVFIERVNSQFAFNVITCSSSTTCAPWYVNNNLFSGYGTLIDLATGGDSQFYANQFAPINVPGSTLSTAMLIGGDPGGSKIFGNKVNAGGPFQHGFVFNIAVSDGDINVFGNSVEGFVSDAVEFNRIGSALFGNVQVNGNQFAAGVGGGARGIYVTGTTGGWLSDITAVGNRLDNASSVAAAIAVGAAGNPMIASNSIIRSTIGIRVEAAATGCMIGANVFNTVTSQIQDASSACTYTAITTTAPTYP